VFQFGMCECDEHPVGACAWRRNARSAIAYTQSDVLDIGRTRILREHAAVAQDGDIHEEPVKAGINATSVHDASPGNIDEEPQGGDLERPVSGSRVEARVRPRANILKKIVPSALFHLRRSFSRTDAIGLGVILLTILVWAMLPAIPQNPSYHQFADQRRWLRVPHAADTLSNIAFALVGVVGLVRLASRRLLRFSPATEACMWCIALGLVCTAMGSAWYHLDPTSATLFWDRLPMTLVFAGVLGAAIAQRVGPSEGRTGLALLVPLGIVSVVYWKMTGDLSLYLILQLGGIAGLLSLLLLTRKGDDSVPWMWVVAWYVLAKVAEFADQGIWDATRGLIGGHTLKHLLAAAAGAAALWPLIRGAAWRIQH
jgi:hypothetical protein